MNSQIEQRIVKTPYNQTRLIGTRWGHMIGLSSDPYQTHSLEFYGEWAKEECGIICSFIKPGDVALDVGANIGTITVAMAKRVGVYGRVFAFEPQQAPFCCLCGNIALTHSLGIVRALNVAVSDFDGTIEVPIVDINKPFNIGGVRLQDEAYDKATKLPKETVPCLKIDSLELPRVDFMKIDVEVMESKVLRGAIETVARCRPAIMAEALCCNALEKTNLDDMLQFFKDMDYEAKEMDTSLYSPNNVRYCTDEIFPGGDRNLFALPNEKEKPEWFKGL